MSPTQAPAKELLRRHGLADVETTLGEHIARQRWAGARDRTTREVSVIAAGVVRDAAPVLLLTIMEVLYADGSTMRYSLPLGLRDEGDALAERAPEFVIRGAGIPPGRLLYDAVGDPAFIEWLMQAIREEGTLPLTRGEMRCVCPDPGALDAAGLHTIRHLRVEQSNTSIEIGDRIFLKWLRRIAPGPAHELEMCDALVRAGFTHAAPLLGRAVWDPGDGVAAPLALVQPFLHNGTEGWALALTSLRDLYADAEEPGDRNPAERQDTVDEQGAAFVAEAGRLGRVIAEMHLALCSPGLGEGIAPVAMTSRWLAATANRMIGELDALLARDDPALDAVRDAREHVVSRIQAVRGLPPVGLLTRIHGDLHLGQMLRVDAGWMVLDFEGEPDRAPEQRRERSSPLRDVAAMLRSFDYAANAAIAERAAPGSPERDALAWYGDAWARANRDAFWAAYLQATAGHPLLPDPGSALVLCRAFEVQKAVYEAGYELGHRPTWLDIPLRFLLRGAAG